MAGLGRLLMQPTRTCKINLLPDGWNEITKGLLFKLHVNALLVNLITWRQLVANLIPKWPFLLL